MVTNGYLNQVPGMQAKYLPQSSLLMLNRHSSQKRTRFQVVRIDHVPQTTLQGIAGKL